ncbi:unnamed protein product [Urochloa humidicola]
MPDTKFPIFATPPPPLTGMFFQDDDPLDPPPPAAANGGLVLKAQPEFPALGRGASWDKFAVLVDATAPSDVARAPLDLVTVLDVSLSMKGQKLQLVKSAMCFLIDQLGPADRLSIVAFANTARRITRLSRMNGGGKAAAKQAVELLSIDYGTNIGEVERERVRIAAAEGIAEARAAADGGQNAGAARILDARLREVERSAPGAAGDDPTCEAIKEELRDLSSGEYQQTGRACLLAGLSAHAQQRAAGVELINSPATAGKAPAARAYLTPKMEEMVELSRESSRKRGSSSQQPSRQDAIRQIKQDLSKDY